MSQAALQTTQFHRLTHEELVKKFGVSPKIMEHLAKSFAVLFEYAAKEGVPGIAVAEILGDGVRELIEKPKNAAYATPEEGLAMLLNEEGGCVGVEEATALYRKPEPVTRSAITERIRKGEMIAYKSGASQYLLPRWQFMPEGGLLTGLSEVVNTLKESKKTYNQLTPFVFFLQANPLTEGSTPLEVLRKGDLDTVKRAARAD